PPMPEPPAEPPPAEPQSDGPQLFDFETDAGPIEPVGPSEPAPVEDDFEALGPADDEAPYVEEEEPYAAEPDVGTDAPREEAYEGGDAGSGAAYEDALPEEERGDDLLSRPPEFVEDEEEVFWFEKGPPQDFDFEDER